MNFDTEKISKAVKEKPLNAFVASVMLAIQLWTLSEVVALDRAVARLNALAERAQAVPPAP